MQRHDDNLASRINGNGLQALAGVSVTVTDDATGLPAALYSDDGVTPISTAIITDENGGYGFYAPNGEYTIHFTSVRITPFTRKLIMADPSDNPYATLAQLAAPSGAGKSGFSHAVAYDPGTLGAKAKEWVSVKDAPYNAKGDGATDDTAAIQAAIDSGKVVHLTGLFKTTASLKLKPETVIVGLSEYDSGIVATGFTYPVFVNDPASGLVDFARLDLSKFAIRNGSYAIKFTVNADGVQSLGDFRNLRFEFQSVRAVECNYAMVADNFTNCVFYYCASGIKTGREANLINLINCRFEGLDQESIIFASTNPGVVRGAESVRVQGCRFEARNTAAITGNSVIRLDTCEGVCFSNCYFENTFTTILTETHSNGTTVFEHGRHTGGEGDVVPTGFKKDVFTSDGVVTFDGNSFTTGSFGTANMRIGAVNPGLSTIRANIWTANSETVKNVTSKSVALTSGTPVSFFRVSRVAVDGINDRQLLTGRLLVSVSGVLNSGVSFFCSRSYDIMVTGFATAAAGGQIVTGPAIDDNTPGAVIAVTFATGQPTSDKVFAVTVTTSNLADAHVSVKLDAVDNFIEDSNPHVVTCLV